MSYVLQRIVRLELSRVAHGPMSGTATGVDHPSADTVCLFRAKAV